jgi:hypothetical protein
MLYGIRGTETFEVSAKFLSARMFDRREFPEGGA